MPGRLSEMNTITYPTLLMLGVLFPSVTARSLLLGRGSTISVLAILVERTVRRT